MDEADSDMSDDEEESSAPVAEKTDTQTDSKDLSSTPATAGQTSAEIGMSSQHKLQYSTYISDDRRRNEAFSPAYISSP